MLMVVSVSPMQPHLEGKCTDPPILEAAVAFSEGEDYGDSGEGEEPGNIQDRTFLYPKKQPGHQARYEAELTHKQTVLGKTRT